MLNKRFFAFLPVVVTCLAFSCKKKGGDVPPPAVPVLVVQNASQTRSTAPANLHFDFALSKTTSVPVTVDYTLVDGTAKAPKDYVAGSGTITIPANQASAPLDVQISGDPNNKREDNLQFTLQLSNPKSCTLGVQSAKGTIITEDGTNLTTDNTGYSTASTYPGYTLVWSDEFSGTSLDLNAWNQETGTGQGGWGNNELEYYTGSTRNVFVSNGNLIIEARRESTNGVNYTSARLTTASKKTFTFGRIDIRAKLPTGKGIWPALWMLGSNIGTVGWPGCGETDIMELIGTYPSRVYATAHWKSTAGNDATKGDQFNLNGETFSDKFHVFSLVWTQDTMKFYVDDQLYLTSTKADVGAANYPFNASQFLIFNVAVGGNWPGSPDSNTPFPERMFVDYVRVFQ